MQYLVAERVKEGKICKSGPGWAGPSSPRQGGVRNLNPALEVTCERNVLVEILDSRKEAINEEREGRR